jgi:hypothetical protein
MKTHNTLLTTLLLCGVPAVALANAGTPLMWGTIFHLSIGNLVLGISEGLLLAWFCGFRKRRIVEPMVLMVLANYFSAIVGLLALARIRLFIALDLHNVWFWVWATVATTYLMTLVLEYPFVNFALRGTPNRLRRSIGASFKIQTISYVLLFLWYGAACNLTILTDLTLVEPSSLSLPKDVAVYYIAEADGDVHRLAFAQGESSFVFDLNSTNVFDRLWTKPSAADSNRWDLVARMETENRDNPRHVVVLDDLATTETVSGLKDDRQGRADEGTWMNFGPVGRLGEARESPWSFWVEFWSWWGMRASQADTGTEFNIGFEMLLGDWRIRNATHLPGDYVLFQLGSDQICVVDPMLKQIALVARGRGPVAVLED